MAAVCRVYRLGLVDYSQAWKLQGRLAGEIAAGRHPAALLLLEHPHTFTFGRRGRIENLVWDTDERQRRGVEVHWVDRGGDVTYHGPGQLVGYPLLPLTPLNVFFTANKSQAAGTTAREATSRPGTADPGAIEPAAARLPQADYVGYLRRLEDSLILALLQLGVAAGQIEGLTGVWVQPDALSRCRNCAPELRHRPAKIAAIGVKVDARGVTRHGFALNVDPDMSYWEGIVGCGLAEYPIAALADLLSHPPEMSQVMAAVVDAFGKTFHLDMVHGEHRLSDFWSE